MSIAASKLLQAHACPTPATMMETAPTALVPTDSVLFKAFLDNKIVTTRPIADLTVATDKHAEFTLTVDPTLSVTTILLPTHVQPTLVLMTVTVPEAPVQMDSVSLMETKMAEKEEKTTATIDLHYLRTITLLLY